MITIEELGALQQAYRAAYNHYLGLCQMHETGLVKAGAVKAALHEAQRLEGLYNVRCTEYQRQVLNAKPAG